VARPPCRPHEEEEKVLRKFLRCKIHRATVTAGDLAYEGSITIDEDLMRSAGLAPYEAVDIYDVTNGNRFQTYAIPGPAGSGTIQINGAAAHLARAGDRIIIACYAYLADAEVPKHRPHLVFVDERNRAKRVDRPPADFRAEERAVAESSVSGRTPSPPLVTSA
jgi:aspartate 1-decarboxylase